MSTTVTLVTDRSSFEPLWRTQLEQLGLTVRTTAPEHLASSTRRDGPLIIDAGSDVYDEDELLTAIGFARALGALPLVHLPEQGRLSGVDDVVEELCLGLVARGERDVPRLASSLLRRLDRARAQRFEFVTISPRDGEVLAVLGDGRAMLLRRPLAEEDDGSEVLRIGLADDAATATLELRTGTQVELHAEHAAPEPEPASAADSNGGNGMPIDGTQLGARLRELRRTAGLTQAELARRTGIHRPNIARVEAGRHTPSLETLTRLAQAIGVSTTHVLVDE